MEIDYSYVARDKDFRQQHLILHYTEINFAQSITTLTTRGVSAHYLVPTLQSIDPSYPRDELYIFNLVPEAKRAWHAGISAWHDRTNINDSSIGIEIVNSSTQQTPQPFATEQIDLVIELCHDILARYPTITPNRILGHSDIAVGRKHDPGPLFPWKKLYEHGIGTWFDEGAFNHYRKQFTKNMPSIQMVVKQLIRYGYHLLPNASTQDLLRAFQMHYRPSNYNGELDIETAAIAYALVDKYITPNG